MLRSMAVLVLFEHVGRGSVAAVSSMMLLAD